MRKSHKNQQTQPTSPTEDIGLQDATSVFSKIYKDYYNSTFDAAYMFCKSKMLSEEIVQEVFVKLWINRENIDEIKNMKSYLFMLTRNLSIDYLRKQKLEKEVFKEYSFVIAKDLYVEESMTREVQRVMLDAVEQLHPQQKRVYQLKKFYGWRRDRIAKQLKISENTVKATMQKALYSVKKYVKERVEI
jgi:RNA polymerase sigma-70 factor (family 1)